MLHSRGHRRCTQRTCMTLMDFFFQELPFDLSFTVVMVITTIKLVLMTVKNIHRMP